MNGTHEWRGHLKRWDADKEMGHVLDETYERNGALSGIYLFFVRKKTYYC